MNRNELAKAYRNIGVAYIAAAEVLEGGEVIDEPPPLPPDPAVAVAGLRPLARNAGVVPAELSPREYAPTDSGRQNPTSSADPQRCPAHGEPYRQGNYGPYCTKPASEPAWADRKGYCSITPRNAGDWLRVHGASA